MHVVDLTFEGHFIRDFCLSNVHGYKLFHFPGSWAPGCALVSGFCLLLLVVVVVVAGVLNTV